MIQAWTACLVWGWTFDLMLPAIHEGIWSRVPWCQAYQMMAFDFEEFDPTQRRDRGLSHVQPASFKLFPQGSLVNFNANNSAVAFSQNPFKKSKTFYKPNF